MGGVGRMGGNTSGPKEIMHALAPGRSGPRQFLNASAPGIFIKASAPGTSGARIFTNAFDILLSLFDHLGALGF